MNKISHKLFLSFSVFILLLLVGIFFFQNFFLQSFYFNRKLNMISDNMNEFVENYLDEDWEEYELNYRLDEFFLDNNASAYISDSYKGYSNSLVLEAEDKDNKIWYVLVEDSNNNVFYEDNSFELGELYYFEGFVSDENDDYIIADTINIESESIDYIDSPDWFKSQMTVTDIKTLDMVEMEELDENSNILAIDEMNDFQGTTYLNDSTYYTISYDPFYATSYVNLVKEFISDGVERAFYVDLNIQSVDELTGILKYYYLYFLIIAVFLAFLFVMFFSNLISRPLVRMSRVANKMANMDFDEKITYESKDELGSLASNLNIMSDSLSLKISQLNEAKFRLEEDIVKERKQEAVRKDFVANVSHELKTPLGVIKSYSEAIKDGIKKEKHEYYLDVIVEEVEVMNKLVLSMLELSKVEAGHLSIKHEEFDIYSLLRKVHKSFELECEKRNLNCRFKGDNTIVKGDMEKIEQVFVNLLSNAVRYSDENTEVIMEIENHGDRCICRITNSCSPMNEEEIENIWNRFYKVDKSHKRELGGTGLGLAIVKAILEGHKSNYGVVQNEKELTFYFDLEQG